MNQQYPTGHARLNTHGILGIVFVLAAVGVASSKGWDIPWFYFIVAVAVYAASILGLTYFLEEGLSKLGRFELLRLMYGAHLSFMFLVGGLVIEPANFWIGVGMFVAAIAAGMVIPYLLVQKA